MDHMGVNPKIGFFFIHQIIHFNRVFHYKPSILGVYTPIFGNTHIDLGPSRDVVGISSEQTCQVPSEISHVGCRNLNVHRSSKWFLCIQFFQVQYLFIQVDDV